MTPQICPLGTCNETLSSAVSFYQEFFPDRFYLSLSRTGRSDEERYIQAALKLAEAHDYRL